MWGRRVEKADRLDEAVNAWLAAPGPALLDVVVTHIELIMPPRVEAAPVFGMALYSAKAVLAGRAGDVLELVMETL
jgi:pyruvate dehydrogenase (quinone)